MLVLGFSFRHPVTAETGTGLSPTDTCKPPAKGRFPRKTKAGKLGMSVVHMSSYRRRGGLKRDAVWTERAFPDRHWIISAVVACADGQRRVVIEPVEDRSMEAVYSETYFRRHFVDRQQWLRRENEKVLRKARQKDSADLLHEMAQINSR